jgi:hypothetical protein
VNASLSEEFHSLPFEQKVSYLIENLKNLPDELVEEGAEVLAEAGEIEYAAVLARDKGMIDKAVGILVNAGDYLWAALIAKNAGRPDEAERLYKDGLQYYTDMEMFGRALSAAEALGMRGDEVDELFRRGIESECKGMDLSRSRAMIDCAMESLEISILGRDDELSKEVMLAVNEERSKMAEKDRMQKDPVEEQKNAEN